MEHPIKHSMKRRCFCHDYSGRGIYMITLEVEGRRPLLGHLAGERIALTPLGEAVANCWLQIPRSHPEVQLLECAVIPDHFHGLLFVRRPMARLLDAAERGAVLVSPCISPGEKQIARAQCLALNQLAAEICGPGAAKLDYAGLVPLYNLPYACHAKESKN